MSRPWYDDGPEKEAILQRIHDGLYIQFSASQQQSNNTNSSRKHVGQVIRTIYSGYKLKLPTGQEVNVNLLKDEISEFSSFEEYEVAVDIWKEEESAIEAKRHAIEDAKQAMLQKQTHCLHEEVQEVSAFRIAGCDINDLVCKDCEKCLKRSWITAYENDPTSLIADWDWFVRYCFKSYNGYVPNQEDYDIVPNIITEEVHGK
jgi:TPP-dependent indolepyruvate ferredoxin oxidoreductase alpha subunit